MSTTVDSAKNHRIFLVETRGSTLLVTPRGDAVGFSGVEFHREKNAILAMLDLPEIHNLVVDLSGANYFGSDTIGAVNSLVVKTRDGGGRYGVCGLSEDMEEGIRIMNLEDLWHVYNSRAEALRAVRSESWLAGLRLDFGQDVKWILLGLLVCVGVWAAITRPWYNPDLEDYRVLSGIMDEYSDLDARDAPPPERKVFVARALRTIEPIEKRLKRTARAKFPARLHLYWAAQRMPNLLKQAQRGGSPTLLRIVRRNLEIARRYIEGELKVGDSPADVTVEEEVPDDASEEPLPDEQPADEPPSGDDADATSDGSDSPDDASLKPPASDDPAPQPAPSGAEPEGSGATGDTADDANPDAPDAATPPSEAAKSDAEPADSPPETAPAKPE